MSTSNWTHPQHPARGRDLDPAVVLTTLLDSVTCGVLVFDARGELRLANGPVAGMLQIEPERLSALADFEAVVAELAQRFAEPEAVAARWRAHFAAGEPSWDELELASPQREKCWKGLPGRSATRPGSELAGSRFIARPPASG